MLPSTVVPAVHRAHTTLDTHEVNIGSGAGMAVLETALLLGLAPEYFAVAVGVKWRINVNQVNAGIRQLLELLQGLPWCL